MTKIQENKTMYLPMQLNGLFIKLCNYIIYNCIIIIIV